MTDVSCFDLRGISSGIIHHRRTEDTDVRGVIIDDDATGEVYANGHPRHLHGGRNDFLINPSRLDELVFVLGGTAYNNIPPAATSEVPLTTVPSAPGVLESIWPMNFTL